MALIENCRYCGGEGVCPRGQCPVRDSPGLPAPKAAARKMPAAAAKAPAVAKPKAAAGRKPVGLTVTASGSVPKAEVLQMWEKLPADRSGSIKPIPYGNRGSAIERFSIRTSGNISEIKDFLAHNKWLLKYENSRKTRLNVSLTQLKDKDTRQPIPDCYVCYIQVHARG
jgi:hypothetical protein